MKNSKIKTFSPTYLYKLWEYSERRGLNFAKLLDLKKVLSCQEEINSIKKNKSNKNKNNYKNCNMALDELRNKLKETIKEEMCSLYYDLLNIDCKKFEFEISQGQIYKNKKTFKLGSDKITLFLNLMMQEHFRNSFNLNFSSRDQLSSQLYSVLNNDIEKIIIKTDIKQFYESVNHEVLLGVINSNSKLPICTKFLTEKLLLNYKNFIKKGKGLLRGIGLSSYLSEVYLNDLGGLFLKEFKKIIFYGRFVDDIIIVISSETGGYFDIKELQNKLNKIFLSKKLCMNNKKTDFFHFTNSNKKFDFDFLGYKYTRRCKCRDPKKHHCNLEISMSTNKLKKYKDKIQKCFDDYTPLDKRRDKILYRRLKILFSNYKLSNSKRNALTGFYYSNHLLTYNSESFAEIGKYLEQKIKETTLNQCTKYYFKITNIKPTEYFKEKKYMNTKKTKKGKGRLSLEKISKLSKIWK